MLLLNTETQIKILNLFCHSESLLRGEESLSAGCLLILNINFMSKNQPPVSPDLAGLEKESASRRNQEDEKDVDYSKRQQIFAP